MEEFDTTQEKCDDENVAAVDHPGSGSDDEDSEYALQCRLGKV